MPQHRTIVVAAPLIRNRVTPHLLFRANQAGQVADVRQLLRKVVERGFPG
ncbi:MAG: hypothetical protein ACK47B_16950 [Armatimonadota bacterium]